MHGKVAGGVLKVLAFGHEVGLAPQLNELAGQEEKIRAMQEGRAAPSFELGGPCSSAEISAISAGRASLQIAR